MTQRKTLLIPQGLEASKQKLFETIFYY